MKITAEAIAAFAELTGDDAPIHRDPEIARSSGFRAPIAQGLLTASFASASLSRAMPPGFETAGSSFSVRFHTPVVSGDTLRFNLVEHQETRVGFEVVNDRDEIVSAGSGSHGSEQRTLAPLPAVKPSRVAAPRVLFAEDLLVHGPRGEGPSRRLERSTCERYFDIVGAFAMDDSSTVPASLVFCFGFADFLALLLACPMPDAAFAGHLGDRWTVHRALRCGEVVRLDYAPVSCTPSRSRPTMGVVRFGFAWTDAGRQPVQDGEVALMVPLRPD